MYMMNDNRADILTLTHRRSAQLNTHVVCEPRTLSKDTHNIYPLRVSEAARSEILTVARSSGKVEQRVKGSE